jgi:hypothetical protein
MFAPGLARAYHADRWIGSGIGAGRQRAITVIVLADRCVAQEGDP